MSAGEAFLHWSTDVMIKVSVVIPVYNVEKYLRDCLSSVVEQTLKDIEIICINDGSLDGSDGILREFSEHDSRFVVITQQNAGVSAARNRGLASATGDYIYFLDSDDFLVPSALETAYQCARDNSLELLVFDSDVVNESGARAEDNSWRTKQTKRSREYDEVGTGRELFQKMVHANDYSAMVWMYLYSKKFLERTKLRFTEKIYFFEDNDFSFRAILQAERARHLHQTLHCYRIRKGAITASRRTLQDAKSALVSYVNMLVFCQLEPPETAVLEAACLIELKRVQRLAGRFYRRVEKDEGTAAFSALDQFAAAHFKSPWSQILGKWVR
jgi:glycosyltransferase involved in cell wall biosynthesis